MAGDESDGEHMSCPKCGDERVESQYIEMSGETHWSLAMDEDGAALKFCPFCGYDLASPPLTWTREKPTQPGLYWATRQDDGYMLPVHVRPDAKGYLWVDYHNDQSLDDWEWFYGPLPVETPAPPTEEV